MRSITKFRPKSTAQIANAAMMEATITTIVLLTSSLLVGQETL